MFGLLSIFSARTWRTSNLTIIINATRPRLAASWHYPSQLFDLSDRDGDLENLAAFPATVNLLFLNLMVIERKIPSSGTRSSKAARQERRRW